MDTIINKKKHLIGYGSWDSFWICPKNHPELEKEVTKFPCAKEPGLKTQIPGHVIGD